MKPITFICHETLPLAPEEVAQQILDVAKWADFCDHRLKGCQFHRR